MKAVVKLVCVMLLSAMPAASELPAPPYGFSWQEIPELKAAFLKPAGWFFKQEKQKDTLAYFITKENIDKDGQFETGLTVNVFRSKKGSAVERGGELVTRMVVANGGMIHAENVGPFRKVSGMAIQSGPAGKIRTYTVTLANPGTNTLYLFIFESPESEWGKVAGICKQIMDNLQVDPKI